MLPWPPYCGLALYDGYMGPIYGLFSVDVICGDWAVPVFFERIVLVYVLMAVLQVVEVLFLRPILWFLVGGSMNFFLYYDEKGVLRSLDFVKVLVGHVIVV